jgi:hypothetical protein
VWTEALVKDNVECVFGNVEEFTKAGIRASDGTEREYDVISEFGYQVG